MILEYYIRLNTAEDTSLFLKQNHPIANPKANPAFSTLQIGSEVLAFGNLFYLYEPIFNLGKNDQYKIQISPLALDASKIQSLNDLASYTQKNRPVVENTEIHVARNQSKKGLSFLTDCNNFYQDFLLWIVKDEKQYIRLIDPKDLRNSKGINDPEFNFIKLSKKNPTPGSCQRN